jgi:hypothetical protein
MKGSMALGEMLEMAALEVRCSTRTRGESFTVLPMAESRPAAARPPPPSPSPSL